MQRCEDAKMRDGCRLAGGKITDVMNGKIKGGKKKRKGKREREGKNGKSSRLFLNPRPGWRMNERNIQVTISNYYLKYR